MELNKIFCEDCLEGMKKIPDNSVDLVFTDPPYNISQKGKIFKDYRNGKNKDINMDFGEWDYEFNMIPFLQETKRVLKDNGSIIVWTSEQLYKNYRK
jgi:site-specific DNA-methyltransferase (adenine-specific)